MRGLISTGTVGRVCVDVGMVYIGTNLIGRFYIGKGTIVGSIRHRDS